MGCAQPTNSDENRKVSYFNKMADLKILKGKNALVTGGNRGLGKEIVTLFAECGANIIFNSSAPNPKAEQFAKEISTTYGVECYYIPCNIRIEKEIDLMIEFAKKKLKTIDILINNAGKACFGSVEDLSIEAYNECMEINLTAPFLFAQKVAPMMKENGWGRIVNYASGTTKIIQTNLSAYIAAKNGVNALTSILAKELGPYGVTCNVVVPGPMDTDMFNDGVNGFASSMGCTPDDIKRNIFGDQIIKEVVKPRSIAEITLFLCAGGAYSQTGGSYACDNGFTC